MAFVAPFPNNSAIALLRIFPILFPTIFAAAAATSTISVLYAAVTLHLVIIGAENTIGRSLANTPIPSLQRHSTLFEDACLLVWPLCHLIAFAAVLYMIIHTEPTAQQIFAIGAIFGYSINSFSATVGHELLHRDSRTARICSDALYAAMLYPHLPTVHLVSHHRWAGSSRDCQTPLPGQQIYGFLAQALIGGLRLTLRPGASLIDPNLHWRATAVAMISITIALVGGMPVVMFFAIQGLFSFIIIETLNYIQHYKPFTPDTIADRKQFALANQDLNFVSRCALFNISLHTSHHVNQVSHYTDLTSIPEVPSYHWGYWTSFWLAWAPPMWNLLHNLRMRSPARL